LYCLFPCLGSVCEVFHWQLTDTAREKQQQLTKPPKLFGRKAIESVEQKFKRDFETEAADQSRSPLCSDSKAKEQLTG